MFNWKAFWLSFLLTFGLTVAVCSIGLAATLGDALWLLGFPVGIMSVSVAVACVVSEL